MTTQKNTRIRNRVEKKGLELKERQLDSRLDLQKRLQEHTSSSIFGTPVDFERLTTFRGRLLSPPIYQQDQFSDKSITVRNMQTVDLIRNKARWLVDTHPNARAIISGVRAFVIGTGFSHKAVSKKVDKNKKLVEQVNDYLDEFGEANDLNQWYSEGYTRSHTEGEIFLRMYPQVDEKNKPKPTQIRAVEPDFCRPPQNQDHEGEWSFGIHTRDGDTQDVIEYSIVQKDKTEIVPASQIHHLKLNVNKNVKRGISSLYAVFEQLEGVAKLRYASTEGEAIRQSIAYVRQHQQADQTAIEEMQRGLETNEISQANAMGGSRDVVTQTVDPGSVQDIPTGLEMLDPPKSPNSLASVAAIRAGLEAVAARVVCPYWLVSGNPSASSYASSLTSSDPFTRRCEFFQAQNTKYWEKVLKSIVEIGMGQGELPLDTLEKIKVTVIAPSVLVRNRKDENQTYKLLSDEGIMSKQTWSKQSDLDFEDEQAKRSTETDLPTAEAQPSQDEPKTPSGEIQKQIDGTGPIKTTDPATPADSQQIETQPDLTLSGVQIEAGANIVDRVATGQLPRDAGLGQLEVLLNLDPVQAERVMGSVGQGEPITPTQKQNDDPI